jgi:hypothetical protein
MKNNFNAFTSIVNKIEEKMGYHYFQVPQKVALLLQFRLKNEIIAFIQI